MKVLICTLNTKYVHSSLAPWCLKSGVEMYSGAECTVYESTINEDTDKIFDSIMSESYDIIAFCVYIWNKEKILSLCQKIRECSKATIVLGGPEVSYNASEILEKNPCLDYVISGEGEEPFGRICNGENAENIPGVSYRLNGKIIEKPPYVAENEPPTPYTKEYFEALKGRIAYIETSRGCPYSCAFCLSGRCGGVRFFDTEKAKENILKLARSGTKTVKLVDRTFNADKKRARDIFSFIIDNYGSKIPEGVCFHFELEGEIIDEETIEVLSGARAGAIQVEIGLQSFNEHTLDAINRRTNINLLCENIRKIVRLGNIHTHIDLIAGLPYEDIKSFEDSFNRAVRLEPHMLQLGFLKLLHGSELRENPIGVYEFDEKPPYEVCSTSYISRDELLLLHKIEDVFEKVYNSQRFPYTVKYLHGLYGSPFNMYKGFALYLDTKEQRSTLDDFTQCMYEFFSNQKQVNKDYLRDCLAMDRLSTNRMGALPEFLKIHSELIKKTLNQLEGNEDTKRRDKIKRAATVLKTSKELIYVDYDAPDPVTGRFEIKRVKI